MGGRRKEACGRCSVSTVVEVASDEEEDEEETPFEGDRIELDESEVRSVARHEVLAARVRKRLDEIATRFVFGR